MLDLGNEPGDSESVPEPAASQHWFLLSGPGTPSRGFSRLVEEAAAHKWGSSVRRSACAEMGACKVGCAVLGEWGDRESYQKKLLNDVPSCSRSQSKDKTVTECQVPVSQSLSASREVSSLSYPGRGTHLEHGCGANSSSMPWAWCQCLSRTEGKPDGQGGSKEETSGPRVR